LGEKKSGPPAYNRRRKRLTVREGGRKRSPIFFHRKKVPPPRVTGGHHKGTLDLKFHKRNGPPVRKFSRSARVKRVKTAKSLLGQSRLPSLPKKPGSSDVGKGGRLMSVALKVLLQGFPYHAKKRRKRGCKGEKGKPSRGKKDRHERRSLPLNVRGKERNGATPGKGKALPTSGKKRGSVRKETYPPPGSEGNVVLTRETSS